MPSLHMIARQAAMAAEKALKDFNKHVNDHAACLAVGATDKAEIAQSYAINAVHDYFDQTTIAHRALQGMKK